MRSTFTWSHSFGGSTVMWTELWPERLACTHCTSISYGAAARVPSSKSLWRYRVEEKGAPSVHQQLGDRKATMHKKSGVPILPLGFGTDLCSTGPSEMVLLKHHKSTSNQELGTQRCLSRWSQHKDNQGLHHEIKRTQERMLSRDMIF